MFENKIGKFKCAFCKGSGVQPRSLRSRCIACRGKGEVEFTNPIKCPSCQGMGRTSPSSLLSCVYCRGVGVIEKYEKGARLPSGQGDAADIIGERLGEITKRLGWTRKETEKRTKEVEKRLKPIKPFIKELKKRNTMVKKIRKQSKEGVGVSLGTVINGFVKGIGRLLGLAAKLEKEGKDEYAEQGEIKGKTKSGKEYRGAYGLRVKVGLNPEDFKGRKKLSNGKKYSV